MQEHEAWLEEPQELATFDSSKTDPLLKDSDSKQGEVTSNGRTAKAGALGFEADKQRGVDVSDQQKAADKLDKLNEV